jgi:hypothetical protein
MSTIKVYCVCLHKDYARVMWSTHHMTLLPYTIHMMFINIPTSMLNFNYLPYVLNICNMLYGWCKILGRCHVYFKYSQNR